MIYKIVNIRTRSGYFFEVFQEVRSLPEHLEIPYNNFRK